MSLYLQRAGALAVAFAVASAGTPSLAQAPSSAGTATGHAAATVISPIAVEGIDDLDFGMVASSGAGTVSINAHNASVSYAGRAREACSGADVCPAPHPARFKVSGERNRGYRISVPSSLETSVGNRSGAELRVVDLIVRSESRPSSGALGVLDGLGNDAFMVGATLEITGALAPGHYTVPVPVSVAYE